MPRNSSTIYVGNIPEDLRRDELKRIFGRYGNIVSATLPVDYYTGIPKGFAFVQYEDIRDAEESFDRLQGYRIGKRSLRLEFATGNKKTPEEMRSFSRRGRSGSPDNRRRSYSGGNRKRSRSRDYRRRSGSGDYNRRISRSPVVRKRSLDRRSRSNIRRRSRSVEVRRSRSFRRASGSPIMSRRNRSRSMSDRSRS